MSNFVPVILCPPAGPAAANILPLTPAADFLTQSGTENPLLHQCGKRTEIQFRARCEAAPLQYRAVVSGSPAVRLAHAALVVGTGPADDVHGVDDPYRRIRRKSGEHAAHVGGKTAAVALAGEVSQTHAVVGAEGNSFT